MKRLIALRLALLVPMLIGISFVSFALAALSSTDPAEASIRAAAIVPTPELIAEVRAELGLDQPLAVQYAHWLAGILTGDLGSSFVTHESVADLFCESLPATLVLAAAALALIAALSLAAGVACARAEHSALDVFIRGFIFITSSMPNFWAGLLLIWFFSVQLDWLPTGGMRSPNSVILPAAALSLGYIGTYMRLIRAEMIRTAHADWVLFARGRGLPQWRITLRMIRSSLRSSATALGMSIPKLVAGAFVIESVFAWPGIGRLCLEAIYNRDIPIIQAYVLLMAAMFIVFNLASDVVILKMDPRERLHRQRGALPHETGAAR